MIIVNFSHPLTQDQRQQIETLAGQPIAQEIDTPCQLDNERPFVPQIRTIIDIIPLSPQQWQTESILINPPAYAPVVALIQAELHGLMGYFPAIIRIRPVADAIPKRFEVAELLDLQDVRDQARKRRL